MDITNACDTPGWPCLIIFPTLPKRRNHLFKCCVNHSHALKIFFTLKIILLSFACIWIPLNGIILYILFCYLLFSTFINIDEFLHSSILIYVLRVHSFLLLHNILCVIYQNLFSHFFFGDIRLFLVFVIIYSDVKDILIHASQEICASMFLGYEISRSRIQAMHHC